MEKGLYLEKIPSTRKNNEELLRKLEMMERDEDRSYMLDEIVLNNLSLVHLLIKRYFKGSHYYLCSSLRITYDDLFSAGLEGLRQGIVGFDLDYGYKFTTYATLTIRSALDKYVNRMKGVSSSDTSMDIVTVENSDGDNVKLSDMLSSEYNLEEDVTNTSFIIELMEELNRVLTPRERQAMRMYMTGEYKQVHIGKELGISQMQVSRVLKAVREKAIEIRERMAV